MTKTLALLDVSGFVHAGSVNKYAFLESLYQVDNVWVSKVTPAGGASLIFNTLAGIAGSMDIILCCDRNPTIKKDMIPGYKGNRDHKQNIEVEKKLVEYIAEQCNISCKYAAGYEADDIIYTLHKALYNEYDKILVYTADSDLYFLIDEKTEIMPTSSKAKHVNMSNYETTKVHGSFYRYNTITVGKVLFGDATDSIPPLSKPLADLCAPLTREFAAQRPDLMGKKDILCKLYAEYPSVIEQINKVYPLEVEGLDLSIKEPNAQMICNWGAAIKNKNYIKHKAPDFDIELETQRVQDLGLYVEREF